jgi:hypothetical protein
MNFIFPYVSLPEGSFGWKKSCTKGMVEPYKQWDVYHRFPLVLRISQPSTVAVEKWSKLT